MTMLSCHGNLAHLLLTLRITTINIQTSLKIGIVGGGFTGTALAAVFHKIISGQITSRPVDVTIFEKSGRFGAGPAYSTPFAHHLLNVRAQDMSAFQDDPTHFTQWLESHPHKENYFDSLIPLSDQFAPRQLYWQYLQHLLDSMHASKSGQFKLILEPAEVVDVELTSNGNQLFLHDGRKFIVDKIILALGNNPPASFPFRVGADIHCIHNPWNYEAVTQISKTDPVLIVGTGLSMIDAVLTLYHQQHEGDIYAVSRHGLLPLSHGDIQPAYPMDSNDLPSDLKHLTKRLRAVSQSHVNEGGDWRSVVNTIRLHLPMLWEKATQKDKMRFLRHLLPYWNIHRHRVHTVIMNLLATLSRQQQLTIISGRVVDVARGGVRIQLRHTQHIKTISIKWLINCMGPTQQLKSEAQPLLSALLKRGLAVLDSLKLGLDITSNNALKDASGQASTVLYALGAPTKGKRWEINAVPDIRSQIFDLARHLLAMR